MPTTGALSFVISVDDFDRSLLDENTGAPGTDSFLSAVEGFFKNEYGDLGGKVEVEVNSGAIRVTWNPDRVLPEYVEMAVERLRRRDYQKGISILRSLLEFAQNDEDILYNLGMAESDTGQLAHAEKHLRHLVELRPKHVNAHVALGVALQRQGKTDDAILALTKAVEMDPRNSYAHRNLGACLLSAGEPRKAEWRFTEAVRLKEEDTRAWLGLAQTREAQGKLDEADSAYVKVIELDSLGEIGESARKARSKLAREEFARKANGRVRMDATMYCLAAMEEFQPMSDDEIRSVVLEIALLGRRGLDVNNPKKQYTLTNQAAHYSGLQLVCMMFVGFKKLGIVQDVSFDLSREFDAAVKLYRKGTGP